MQGNRQSRFSDHYSKSQPTILTNSNGEIVGMNDEMSEFLGYNEEELTGETYCSIIADPSPENGRAFQKILAGEKFSGDVNLRLFDDSVVTVSYSAKRLEDDNSAFVSLTIENVDSKNIESVAPTRLDELDENLVAEVTQNIRIEAPDENFTLQEIILDTMVSHNQLEDMKKGGLTLYKVIDERLQEEEERNPDSIECEVLEAVKRSVFGLYLRVQRGDKELKGDRPGRYSNYFK
jgi:PAS domain S-box-containing protein